MLLESVAIESNSPCAVKNITLDCDEPAEEQLVEIEQDPCAEEESEELSQSDASDDTPESKSPPVATRASPALGNNIPITSWSSWALASLKSTEEAMGASGDLLSSATLAAVTTTLASITEPEENDASSAMDYEEAAETTADSLLKTFQWGWSSVVEQTKASIKQVEQVLVSEEGWHEDFPMNRKKDEQSDLVQGIVELGDF